MTTENRVELVLATSFSGLSALHDGDKCRDSEFVVLGGQLGASTTDAYAPRLRLRLKINLRPCVFSWFFPFLAWFLEQCAVSWLLQAAFGEGRLFRALPGTFFLFESWCSGVTPDSAQRSRLLVVLQGP